MYDKYVALVPLFKKMDCFLRPWLLIQTKGIPLSLNALKQEKVCGPISQLNENFRKPRLDLESTKIFQSFISRQPLELEG